MFNPNNFSITDDSGFLAIVNSSKYNSFVNDDWTTLQLMNHFAEEMKSDSLIFWPTGSENTWSVSFVNTPSAQKAFSTFRKTIEVTSGRLFLTNYEDLSLAAQFEDQTIPSKHYADLFIQLENGRYELTIRQLFVSDREKEITNDDVDFEIVVLKDIQLTPFDQTGT